MGKTIGRDVPWSRFLRFANAPDNGSCCCASTIKLYEDVAYILGPEATPTSTLKRASSEHSSTGQRRINHTKSEYWNWICNEKICELKNDKFASICYFSKSPSLVSCQSTKWTDHESRIHRRISLVRRNLTLLPLKTSSRTSLSRSSFLLSTRTITLGHSRLAFHLVIIRHQMKLMLSSARLFHPSFIS